MSEFISFIRDKQVIASLQIDQVGIWNPAGQEVENWKCVSSHFYTWPFTARASMHTSIHRYWQLMLSDLNEIWYTYGTKPVDWLFSHHVSI